ncbi:MAG: hypothetical protein JWO36_5463 [Myxococcales bacterium]|nr:hypothetical protein [Myxococcales bacterium]
MPAIERIAAPASDTFWRDYVVPRRPVILTDLIAGFPHTTVESIVGAFADHELSDASGAGLVTLGAWWATVQRSLARDASATAELGRLEHALAQGGYSSRHTSTDIRVPASFFDQADKFRDTHAALRTPLDRAMHERGLGAGGSNTVMLFLGHPGVTTPCHVDGWVAQTFNTQLAGNKEWFLVPPQASAALGPCGFTYLVDPMRMPADDRAALAESLGGYSFVVAPGETLYFPHQWLHGTAYPEPSFSFVQHFGRDLYSMFVSREVHRGFFRHAVMQTLYPAAVVEQRYRAEFTELHDACKRDYADARARYLAIEGVLRSLFERFYPDIRIADLPFDLEAIKDLEEAKGIATYAADGPVTYARKGWTTVTGKPLFDWWLTA